MSLTLSFVLFFVVAFSGSETGKEGAFDDFF